MSRDLDQATALLSTALTTMQAYTAQAAQTQARLDEVIASHGQMAARFATVQAELKSLREAVEETRPLSGWKEILPVLADLGRPCGERQAAYLASRSDDPLPVWYVDGRVKSARVAIADWVTRNAKDCTQPAVSVAIVPIKRAPRAAA